MDPEQQPAPDQSGAAPEPFVPLAGGHAPQQVSDEYPNTGWSWGAFILGPMFLIAIRRYLLLLLYLLCLIPFLNIFVWLGISIYLGVRGREMASSSTMFARRCEFGGFMKGIDHAGKIFFIFYVVIFAIMLFSIVTVFMGLSNTYENKPTFGDYDSGIVRVSPLHNG